MALFLVWACLVVWFSSQDSFTRMGQDCQAAPHLQVSRLMPCTVPGCLAASCLCPIPASPASPHLSHLRSQSPRSVSTCSSVSCQAHWAAAVLSGTDPPELSFCTLQVSFKPPTCKAKSPSTSK